MKEDKAYRTIDTYTSRKFPTKYEMAEHLKNKMPELEMIEIKSICEIKYSDYLQFKKYKIDE